MLCRRVTDCHVAPLLAIITCFHTTINENVIYWRYGRSLMSYPRSGRRILQPFQFGKEDQLLSEKTTKSRLAAPQHLLWPEHNLAEKTGPAPGQFPVPFFGRSLPYFHNNDRQKPAPCQPTRPFLATALWEKEGCPLLICANHFETAPGLLCAQAECLWGKLVDQQAGGCTVQHTKATAQRAKCQRRYFHLHYAIARHISKR